MKVETEITLAELNGVSAMVGEKKLKVRNVWNKNRLVELQIGDNGEKVAVHKDDLLKAIENATGNERTF